MIQRFSLRHRTTAPSLRTRAGALLLGGVLGTFSLFAAASPEPCVGIWHGCMEKEALAPASNADVAAPRGGMLTMGAVGAFDSFNSFAPRGIAAALSGYVYETLGSALDGDSTRMRGLLAESFDLAQDRSSMIVTLRKEARFADGHPVTSEDVVYTFEALMKEASPTYASYYRDVKKVEALDERRVVFTFAGTENRELPLIVAQLPVLPAHWWRGRSLGEPQKEPMPGSGPYRPDTWQMGREVVYRKNDDWWGRNLPANAGRYNFETIRVEYYRDFTVMREAFFAGRLDYYPERTIKDWHLAYDVPAVRDGKIERREFAFERVFGMSGLFFNTRRAHLADRRVREALALLFDFEKLNRGLFYNAYRRSDSFFSGSPLRAVDPMTPEESALLASLPGMTPERLARLSGPLASASAAEGLPSRERLRRALSLFKEAGWTLRNGKLVNAQGTPLTLDLPLSQASSQRLYAGWRSDLARAGIELRIRLLDQTQYVSTVRQRDYDLVFSTVRQSENPGNEQAYFWGSAAADQTGSRNHAGIRDAAVDALNERIARPASEDDLRTSVRVLDRVLLDGWYVVPGWYGDASRVAWWRERITPPSVPFDPKRGTDLTTWHRAKSGH